jgi:hypothetical protein
MNMPPMVLDLKVVSSGRRRPVRLWLPLFLMWPFALVLGVLALVLTIVADAVLLVLGRRYHHYTVLLARSCEALGETRGTVIRFSNEKTAVDVTVQ